MRISSKVEENPMRSNLSTDSLKTFNFSFILELLPPNTYKYRDDFMIPGFSLEDFNSPNVFHFLFNISNDSHYFTMLSW